MKNKNTIIISLVPFFFSAIMIATNLLMHAEFAIDDDYCMDDLALIDELDLVDFNNPPVMEGFRASPQTIILILKGIGAIPVLEEPLFLLTSPLKSRDLVDELFEPAIGVSPRCFVIGFDTFWNQTFRSHFTAKESDIKHYLALTQRSLIDKLEKVASNIRGLVDEDQFRFDIGKTFNLFERMTVEERRIGLMFQAQGFLRTAYFRIFFPLYYHERNFILSRKEQQAIEDELGALDPQTQKEFQKGHLISDQFGIGDTRFEVDFPLLYQKKYDWRAGFLFTIPTAGAFAKGLGGSYFEPTAAMPTLDFNTLFDLSDGDITESKKNEAIKMAQRFLLGSIDRVSGCLLNQSMGNGTHLGIGLYSRFFIPFNQWSDCFFIDHCSFYSYLMIEYLFPGKEKRFFVRKIEPREFQQRNFDDPTVARDNLTFIEREIVDRFYPLAFDTLVQPGPIIRWNGKVMYESCLIDSSLGVDFWFQGKDHLFSIHAPGDLLKQLDYQKSPSLNALEFDIFGSLGFHHDGRTADWFFEFFSSYTLVNRGIGKELLVRFSVSAYF